MPLRDGGKFHLLCPKLAIELVQPVLPPASREFHRGYGGYANGNSSTRTG